jgi:hypothetical protein
MARQVGFQITETPRHSQSVCSDVLANEVIRTVLDENFILWGGDVARMEAHQAG